MDAPEPDEVPGDRPDAMAPGKPPLADAPLPDGLDDYLLPPAEAPALWCAFDPGWYLAAHPQAREALGEAAGFEAARAWYLEHGQPLGHSPVIWFDEAWYRAANPAVAAAIAAGQWRSGFEQYCLEGSADRSPHWLYDEALYRSLNPDLTDEALGASGCFNRYDHYLRDGAFAGRPAHLLFDPALYAAAHADDPALARSGAFTHYLQSLWSGAAEPPTTPYFDPAWYRAFYPEAAAAIAASQYRGALHHYLANPTPAAFDPLVDFLEAHYLAANPDVAAEVKAGRLRNGYEHFLKSGAAERRNPAPWIDLRHYLAANPEAAAALESRAVPHAWAHLLRVGLPAGFSLAPPAAAGPTVARARALLPLRSRGRLDFTCDVAPVLTAIVTLPIERARALPVLSALRAEAPGAVELLLLDATGHGPGLAAMLPGARVIPMHQAPGQDGAGLARDTALAEARAPTLLLLDAGSEPAPGSIAAALARLAADPACGAAGGPGFGPDGRLLQAGFIVFNDASIAPYLAGAPTSSAEANFLRPADACSTALLALRRAALRPPDPDRAAGPAADADLCLGIWQNGYRVLYDPAIATLRDDPRAARAGAAPGGRDTLAARHPAYLATRPAPIPAPAHAARSPLVPRDRILLIEPSLPPAATLAPLLAEGAALTLYPLDGGPADPALLPADLPGEIELICGPGQDGLQAFLTLRGATFTRVEGAP